MSLPKKVSRKCRQGVLRTTSLQRCRGCPLPVPNGQNHKSDWGGVQLTCQLAPSRTTWQQAVGGESSQTPDSAKGSRLGQRGGVDHKLGVWACGTGQQQVHDPRPPTKGSPSLSIGTSHFEPRRQS